MSSDTLTALAMRLGAKLKAQGLMLATVESCTGGWVAQAVTAVAGSSDWFDRGFVSYSNAAKQEMLGVSAETLARHGAVSEQTACEMAAGALVHSRAQVALAITGIAGPSGGSPEKPVGTVCFAWSRKDAAPIAQTRQFEGDRESVRRQSVAFALQTLLELLEIGGKAPRA
jgi:nicotinamide-nucleotide amidase